MSVKIIGVEIHRPSFGDITFSVAFATGCLVALIAIYHLISWPVSRTAAVSLFAGGVWGALSARIGIELWGGVRHKLLWFGGLLLFVIGPGLVLILV